MTVHQDTLQFFEELHMNNNREWFAENKKRWEAIRKDFLKLTQWLIEEMAKLDPSIGNPTADKCMYRIYRDLRFSPDKRPYKTHNACFLASGGVKRCGVPGYYLQLGQEDYGLTGGCSLGGGIFMPSPKALEAIRQEIYYNTDEFKAIMATPEYQKYFGNEFYTMHKLQRAPKGYPNDWKDVELLKYKDYTTMYDMPNEFIMDEDFGERCVEIFKASVPLNKFIQKAMYELI